MAGTDGYSLRRWNSGGRSAAWHCGSQDVSLEQTSDDQVVCGAGDVEPTARRWEKRPTRCDPECGQRVGPQVTWLETDRLFTENEQETDFGYSVSEHQLHGAPVEDVFNGYMNTFGGDVLEPVVLGQPAHCVAGQTCGSAGSGAVRRRRTSSRRAAGGRECAVRAVPHVGAGGVRAVHSAQGVGAEAGSDNLDNFVAAFHTCENHAIRTDRVNVILHAQHSQNSQTHNSHSTIARSLHGVHVARCVQNSSNSLGDGVVRGRGVCVRGETKSLSTSTRSGVRRSAVYESAHTQQTPLKMHEETWAGLLRNQGPKIFREVEIVPGCAVVVACPSCPDSSPEPPGRGRIIRNLLGWSQLEETDRSGVWLFRCALRGENLFSSLAVAGDWERKGSYRTAWSVLCDSSCACSYAYGLGPAIGPHTGKQCWPLLAGVWRAIAPLMQPWCAEGEEEVPTAANLNLYRGWKSCVGWHCDAVKPTAVVFVGFLRDDDDEDDDDDDIDDDNHHYVDAEADAADAATSLLFSHHLIPSFSLLSRVPCLCISRSRMSLLALPLVTHTHTHNADALSFFPSFSLPLSLPPSRPPALAPSLPPLSRSLSLSITRARSCSDVCVSTRLRGHRCSMGAKAPISLEHIQSSRRGLLWSSTRCSDPRDDPHKVFVLVSPKK